jgi:hypothetical protein
MFRFIASVILFAAFMMSVPAYAAGSDLQRIIEELRQLDPDKEHGDHVVGEQMCATPDGWFS